MTRGKKPSGLPTREQILAFIEESDRPAGKREIAREFGLKGQEKIALKAMLKDMADEGLIDSDSSRAFHKMGGVPKVTVLKVAAIEDDNVYAVPEKWEAEGVPVPRLRVVESKSKRAAKGHAALGVGDRILARTEERGKGLIAYPMKKLPKASETLLGVVEKGENDRFWLRSVDKRARFDTAVSDLGDAEVGQLVLAEKSGQGQRTKARIVEVLGEPLAPKSFSLIAIHKYGIPHVMPEAVEEEAARAAKLPIVDDNRTDLRDVPLIAIDPADARDHDDAIWAAPDDAPDNKGGHVAIVAIADVSHYVRPGGALDREAKKRGNSVYFPDRVVPMLPHSLSSDMCSLKAGEDRASLVCHMRIDKTGKLKSWRFERALVRLAGNVAYEDAQAAMDGKADSELKPQLTALWDAWRALFTAREDRGPLELDLPERRIILDDEGRIETVAVRERLDAHRVVEDFMIAANVAAAKALEAKKSSLLYRVHEPPAREKLVALKDYLKTLDLEFSLGQVVVPGMFNRIIERVDDELLLPQLMEQVLRTQTQAYYTPNNAGHFGLALGSYAHFTSPIRRYADLIVHRALVGAYGLEQAKPPAKLDLPATTKLSDAEIENLDRTAEAIGTAERRAMEAERETVDRYVAAYLSERVGEVVETRITGVQNFGFFATVLGFGGDGLVPVSDLGSDYYRYDEESQTLTGDKSGTSFTVGQRLELRLAEANALTGALRFALPDVTPSSGRGRDRGPARDKYGRPSQKRGKDDGKQDHRKGKRGRPANIRHQGGKRRPKKGK